MSSNEIVTKVVEFSDALSDSEPWWGRDHQEELTNIYRAMATESLAESHAETVCDSLGSLHAALTAIADELDDDPIELLPEVLSALGRNEMGANISPEPNGPDFDLETLESYIEAGDWSEVLNSAERELHRLPGSIAGASLKAVALLHLSRYEDAITVATAVAERFPTRYPLMLAAAASFLSNDEAAGFGHAFASHRYRSELNPPETWRNIPGLAMLSDDDETLVSMACQTVVQSIVDQYQTNEVPVQTIYLHCALLLASLRQANKWLESMVEMADQLGDLEQQVLWAGLARIQRWNGDYDAAFEFLDKVGGNVAGFVAAERKMTERDAELANAGKVHFEGLGQRFDTFRTPKSMGAIWYDDDSEMKDEQDLGDKTEASIADKMRDRASEWIASGFAFEVIEQGALASDGQFDDDSEEEAADEEAADKVIDIGAATAMFEQLEYDGLLKLAEAALVDHPDNAVALTLHCTALVGLGRNAEAVVSGRRAVSLRPARPVLAPLAVALFNEDPLQGCKMAASGFGMPSAGATPEMGLENDGLQLVSGRAGELLDAIESKFYNSIPASLLLFDALLTPSVKSALERLQQRFDDLESVEQGIACLALASISRYFDAEDDCRSWLRRASEAGFEEEAEAERLRLEQDLAWVKIGGESGSVKLEGFGLSLTIGRDDIRIEVEVRRGDMGEYKVDIVDAGDDVMGFAFKDKIRTWLAMGFRLVGDT